MDTPVRVLVTKVGLDGHDRGAKQVARGLRDAGMEVVYLKVQAPEAIVRTVVEEDIDVVGISILSGAHMTLLPRVCRLLKESGAGGEVLVIAGGTIPAEDHGPLREAGIAAIFGPESRMADVVDLIRRWAERRDPARA